MDETLRPPPRPRVRRAKNVAGTVVDVYL